MNTEDFDGDIPFRAECYKGSRSHGPAVGLCVCSHAQQEEASDEQGTDL